MSRTKKIGVIVARMQCHVPTYAHERLLETVMELSDDVIIILGESHGRNTKNNPLPWKVREHAIRQLAIVDNFDKGTVAITPLQDHKCDKVWSEFLDEAIDDNLPYPKNMSFDAYDYEITLYGARDSFIKYYSGIHKTVELKFDDIFNTISATKQRENIHRYNLDRLQVSDDFRKGLIWASNHRYPVSFQTVDIAILHPLTRALLVGKKQGESGYRFIGGFVDPSDSSLEGAAEREVNEETGGIHTKNYQYLGSFRIDDWRYRNESDKIMTAFFRCDYTDGRSHATDDISELKWLAYDAIKENTFEPEHEPLKLKLLEHLNIN